MRRFAAPKQIAQPAHSLGVRPSMFASPMRPGPRGRTRTIPTVMQVDVLMPPPIPSRDPRPIRRFLARPR